MLYAVIYFYGLDGAHDYFWVNNGFFLVEMTGIAAVITGILAAKAIRSWRELAAEQRDWRQLRPFLTAAVLTFTFVPYAIVLAFLTLFLDMGQL